MCLASRQHPALHPTHVCPPVLRIFRALADRTGTRAPSPQFWADTFSPFLRAVCHTPTLITVLVLTSYPAARCSTLAGNTYIFPGHRNFKVRPVATPTLSISGADRFVRTLTHVLVALGVVAWAMSAARPSVCPAAASVKSISSLGRRRIPLGAFPRSQRFTRL